MPVPAFLRSLTPASDDESAAPAASRLDDSVTLDAAALGPDVSAPHSLRRNFSWTTLGNTVYLACQAVLLVMLTRLEPRFGTALVGPFTLGLAITAPIALFANLQLRAVQATDTRREYCFGHYFALRIVCTVLALVATLVAAAWLVVWGGRSWQAAVVVLAVGVSKALESLSDVLYGVLHQHEQMDRIAISMLLKGPLAIVGMGLGVWLSDGDILWGVVGLIVPWAAILIAYDVPRARALVLRDVQRSAEPVPSGSVFRPIFDVPLLGRLAWYLLPMGLSMFLVSLNTNIPRYFIEFEVGNRELGVFANLAALVVLGSTLVNALGQAAIPRLARHYADGDLAGFHRLTWQLVLLGAAAGVVGVAAAALVGRPFLAWLFRPDYAEYNSILIWLMAAGGFSYMAAFLGYAIAATRSFHQFTIPYVALTGVTILASWLLIPRFELLGGAWAVGIVSLGSCIAPLVVLALIRRTARHESTAR